MAAIDGVDITPGMLAVARTRRHRLLRLVGISQPRIRARRRHHPDCRVD
ncbi:hypothetical protein AB4212_26385 [Streptomyces sp. 2MCAF27]